MGKRHRYTSEFKAEAVRLAATSGQPVAQIARELGLTSRPCTNGSGKLQDPMGWNRTTLPSGKRIVGCVANWCV